MNRPHRTVPVPRSLRPALLFTAAVVMPACSAGEQNPTTPGESQVGTLQEMADGGRTQPTAPAGEWTSQQPPALRSRMYTGGGVEPAGDSYAPIQENTWTVTSANPLATFAADVDTASFANVRRFLREGRLPPADAVRIEELVNALRYDDPEPPPGEVFGVRTELGPCPWNPEHMILRVGVRTAAVDAAEVPPCNLVFLLDVSGSMSQPDKLPLLVRGMDLLVDQLRPRDRVAIVTYAGRAGVALDSTSGERKAEIRAALQELRAGGSTAGAEGIRTAYELAQQQFRPDGINRVILGTDGDFNVGISSKGELEDLIASKRDSGVYLSVLGFGRGNLRDDRMETLADKGNGNYSYIDSLHQARRTLVEEFGATMMTVAKDVKLQVEFDPMQVESYRLLGYENRMLTAEEFRDDKVDAGEMGAGHTVTALFELVPTKTLDAFDRVATLRTRHKRPDGDQAVEREYGVLTGEVDLARTSPDFRLAVAAAALGLQLRGSEHKGALNWGLVRELARSVDLTDGEPMRRELVAMADRAAELAASVPAEDPAAPGVR